MSPWSSLQERGAVTHTTEGIPFFHLHPCFQLLRPPHPVRKLIFPVWSCQRGEIRPFPKFSPDGDSLCIDHIKSAPFQRKTKTEEGGQSLTVGSLVLSQSGATVRKVL